jgi:hypothetical protein
MGNTSIIRAEGQTSIEPASAAVSRSRFNGLRSRVRLLATASGTFVAALACVAAVGTPAQAKTTPVTKRVHVKGSVMPVGNNGANCQEQGVGWSSAPLKVTMTGTICAGTNASKSGVYNLTVYTSIAGWASPFVSVTGVTGGGHWTSEYGGDEVMSTNTHVTVRDPFCSLPVASGNVSLSVAMNEDGNTHKSASISPDIKDSLLGLAACLGETFA